MRKISLFILPIIMATGVAFANTQINTTNNGEQMTNSDKKVLVAYFSWGGNTKSIANKIHARIGGDMFEIETATPYPRDYQETAYGIAKTQHDENIHPELKSNGDVSSYDIVFIGTPVWWYEMAPAVKTFLENNNFNGKTIAPFITHGGGGEYTIASDIGKMAPGATVRSPLVVYGSGNAETDTEIMNWLNQIK